MDVHGRDGPLEKKREVMMRWVEIKRRQISKTLHIKTQASAFGYLNVDYFMHRILFWL